MIWGYVVCASVVNFKEWNGESLAVRGQGYLDVEHGADVRHYGSPSRTGVLEVLAFFRPCGKCTDARVSKGSRRECNPRVLMDGRVKGTGVP